MLGKLLTWRWGPGGKLGLGAALGLLLIVLPSLLFIALDMAKMTRQVEPPPFFRDWKPESQQICKGIAKTKDITKSNAEWHEKGWAAWPEPETIPCEYAQGPAPDGVVRWHSCEAIRIVNGVHEPACTLRKISEQPMKTGFNDEAPGFSEEVLAPPGGITWVHIQDGVIVAADIYLQEDRSLCTAAHEEGHARGFVILPEEDAKTSYISGAHTERPGHLLGENCGDDWSWLDRNEGGDWPYN